MVGEVVAFYLINLNILSPCSLKWRWQWHDIVAAISLSTYCITCCRYVESPGSSPMDHSMTFQSSSVTQSCLTLRPHNCSTPGLPIHHQLWVYPNSCPLSWWCYPTISSSVIPFSSPLQSSLASGSFPMSQFFASVGQSIGVSVSTSVLPMNIQDWFPLGWTGWISLQSKGSQKSLPHHSSKASILRCSSFFIVQLSHPYMTTGKTTALTRQTFVDKVMSLLFNMLSRLVITFQRVSIF